MAKKQTSAVVSSLAGRVLKGYAPTKAELYMLAASVLAQDEMKGQKKIRVSRKRKAKA